MRKILVVLLFLSGAVWGAGSSIDPTVPAANSALQSAPVRSNFLAAYTDINALIGMNNSATAPVAPILGQLWLNTTATPYMLNLWDGFAWDEIGTLNSSTNKFAIPIAQGGTGLTAAGTSGCVLTSNGSAFTCSLPTNTGTVTSAGLLLPSVLFNVTGSPITASGTFAASLNTQTANTFFAGPTSGGATAPTFRAIVAGDIPTLNQNTTGTAANVTGTVAAANGGTGLTTCSSVGYVLNWNGSGWSCSAPTAGGTVTSVGLSLPISIFALSGTPVTSSGTLTATLNTEPANYVWAGPTTGSAASPTFRGLVAADIPTGSNFTWTGTNAFGTVTASIGDSSGASFQQAATGYYSGGGLTITGSNVAVGTGISGSSGSSVTALVGGTREALINSNGLTIGQSALSGQSITVNGAASGSGGGTAFYSNAGGANIAALGGYSAILGGAYNGTPVLWGASTLDIYVGGVVAQIASTGVAVTGTLSSTGVLTSAARVTSSGARAVNTGTTSDTIAAGKAATFESTNSATITLTLAAPTGDGERRRVCFNSATTVTWAVTSPATATAGLPTALAAGACVETVYNSASGTPTNAAATTWYPY